jgi:cell fate regulator YaaT (PSP1 superfamily)
MDDKELEYNEHNHNRFLSRGCCHPPQIYQDNANIAEHRCCKLDSYDWLNDLTLPEDQEVFDCVEIRFKNSRKDFFRVYPDMKLLAGDIVAVEASPGHDIGIVTLTGEIVRLQMRKKGVDPKSDTIKKVYRRARLTDIEKWLNVVDLEDRVKIRSRKIARNLDLMMKVNDVEYQGDETKAIFYYTADDRVDFRELIKVLAEEFKVRIEMRQIGARQEAARLGGIGSCGRELCCSTWLTNFNSVSTSAARTQQLSLNPQKLAGQCGKLKCCLNYENDVYLDALKEFPRFDTVLKTKKGEGIYQKADVFKKIMWYSYQDDQFKLLALPTENVIKIIEQNKKGVLPDQLEDFSVIHEPISEMGTSTIEEEDISRFDKMDEKPRKKKGGRGRGSGNQGRRNSQNRQGNSDKQAQRKSDDKQRGDADQKRDSNQRREGSQGRNNNQRKENQRRDGNQRRDNNQRKDSNPKRDGNQNRDNKPRRNNRENNQNPDKAE